jgi:RNA polymerase sigma-70 factor (ECF subfamily)
MMSGLETNELIDRARTGDQTAYTELVKRYQPQVQAVCLKMVHNRETARDLTQETFVKAFGALGSFDRTYTFSTWLYKIARNTCIDHFRRSKLETFSLDAPMRTKEGEMERDFPSPTHTPERHLLLKEKGRLITEAIDSLPEKYREVIHMRHTQELPYEEIASILGVPLGTVKARLFRARELLKKRLKTI